MHIFEHRGVKLVYTGEILYTFFTLLNRVSIRECTPLVGFEQRFFTKLHYRVDITFFLKYFCLIE